MRKAQSLPLSSDPSPSHPAVCKAQSSTPYSALLTYFFRPYTYYYMNYKHPDLLQMHDWESYDVTHFAIGRALGVIDRDYLDIDNVGALFYTKNMLSDALVRITDELVRIGYMEYDQKLQRYRLKKGFDMNVPANVIDWPPPLRGHGMGPGTK